MKPGAGRLGQSWCNTLMHRVNAGQGFMMYWRGYQLKLAFHRRSKLAVEVVVAAAVTPVAIRGANDRCC